MEGWILICAATLCITAYRLSKTVHCPVHMHIYAFPTFVLCLDFNFAYKNKIFFVIYSQAFFFCFSLIFFELWPFGHTLRPCKRTKFIQLFLLSFWTPIHIYMPTVSGLQLCSLFLKFYTLGLLLTFSGLLQYDKDASWSAHRIGN